MTKEHKTAAVFDDELAVCDKARRFLKQDDLNLDDIILEFNSFIDKYSKFINMTGRLCSISDVQSRELKRRETEIKSLLDNSDQGFLTFGQNLIIDKEHSLECTRIFNEKIANRSILEVLSTENEEQNRLFANGFETVFKLRDKEAQSECLNELPNLLKIRENYISIKYKVISTDFFEENSERLLLILTDITERRKVKDQILYLSFHDKLTTLSNRAYVESIIPQLQNDSNLPFSIIMADLNSLKLVNDVFGHENGDHFIVQAAKVFRKCCRKTDIVARWGGDEFLIILPGADQETCTRICSDIKAMLETLSNEQIGLSASLGGATLENWDTGITNLISMADSVMYSNKLLERKETINKIISGLEKLLQAKYSASIGQSERIEAIANRFAQLLDSEQEPQEMLNLLLLARLHDIGKVALPSGILNKNTTLSANELELMREYPKTGYRMAQAIGKPVLAQEILAIREQWAGLGYPYGLKGEQIPFRARLISIIEAYDVMTHDQPYKPKMSHAEALDELKRCAGTQFDPNLAALFLNNISFIIN